MTRTPRPFLVYAVSCSLAALVLFVALWRWMPPHLSLAAVLLVVAVSLSENFQFSIEPYSVSLAFPLGMASAVLCGPVVSCIVAASSAINYRDVRQGKPASIILFNLAQLVLSTGLAASVYVLLGGRVLEISPTATVPLDAADFPQVLLPLAAMALLCVLGNMLLLAIGMSLFAGQPIRNSAGTMLTFVPTQLALAFVGFLVAQVLAISIWAFPLFIAPLIVARQLYLRYAGLMRAYADTIRSLVGALEAKDPYTRGHSERVSEYASALGAAMHLDERAVDRLQYSALLHDVGKLAVPKEILVKPGKLAPRERELIREHPARGAEMINRIPHLRDLTASVAQHHECIDGSGYPAGIRGHEMTIAAKILAVADAYDAMTTTRAYRPALSSREAIAELVRNAGSQFDEPTVRAFVGLVIDGSFEQGTGIAQRESTVDIMTVAEPSGAEVQ